MVKVNPVALALSLAALQFVFAFLLFWLVVTVAYSYEGIESWDQLGYLGGGAQFAVIAAWLPPLVCTPLTLVLLLTRFRARAWYLPCAGLILSAAGWLWAVSTFEQPSIIGG
jgi:hypothetical protein